MIEKNILDYLNERMIVPAFMEIPDDHPARFLIIEKTGGSEENHLKSTVIAVKSYADSLYEAALLNESLIQTMREVEALDEICSCRLNTDYNFSDTVRNIHRYQAVFDIFYY